MKFRIVPVLLMSLFMAQAASAQPCGRICNEVGGSCDAYDALETINRDLPASPLFAYYDVCLRGHEWASLETLYRDSGIWSYHKGLALNELEKDPSRSFSPLSALIEKQKNMPGDALEIEDDLEIVDSLRDEIAIRNAGASLRSVDVLYAAYRVLRTAAANLKGLSETQGTQGHQIAGGMRLLEGAMYLSTLERDEDAYALASGSRDCIVEVLIDGNRESIDEICLEAMRDRLALIWEQADR